MRGSADYLVAYDISDKRRLRRVAKLMERFGARVQKSVFECALPPATVAQMVEAARKLIDPAVDGIRIYPLPGGALQRATLLGLGPEPALAEAALVV
jgi:CRISPR-associated protein Cas2